MKPIYEVDKQAINESETTAATDCVESAGQKSKKIEKNDENGKKDS